MAPPILRAARLFTSCIVGAWLLSVLASHEFHSIGANTGLLLLTTLAKVTYFITATLNWIHRSVTSAQYRKCMMGFLVLQMLLIVLSFGVYYYCLYQLDPSSFRVIADRQHPSEQFLVFLYFSLGKYTTAGVGDIHPISPVALLCTMTEMVVAYFTTVLIIANVGYLQVLFGQKPSTQ